ncbi:MAG TPA: hypothetical protein VGP05_15410 [Pseudonocardia sp.]|nr:hypothetical protein [Pseudonocardia sp.]
MSWWRPPRPISGALLELDGLHTLAGWKWMFLLEGAFSIAVGIATGFLLVSRVGDAKWLSSEEKAALIAAVTVVLVRARRVSTATQKTGDAAALAP